MKQKIDLIETEYIKMNKYYGYLENSENWIFDREENNIRLEYKILEEEKTIEVKMFAEIDMEIIPFLAIISEIDFQAEYVPFVYEVEEVKKIARNRKVGYSKTYMPILTDR